MPREAVIAFSDLVWEQVVAALDDDDETAGVLLAGVAEDDDRLTYTVNRVAWVPSEHYAERTPRRLSIASAGWVPALKAAAKAGLQPIFLHTHPGAPPTPSALER